MDPKSSLRTLVDGRDRPCRWRGSSTAERHTEARSCRGAVRRRSNGRVPARQKGDAKEGSLSGPSFASCSDALGKEAEPREDLPKPARRQVVASEDAVDLGGAARALLRVRRGEPTAPGQPGRSPRPYRRAAGARAPRRRGTTGAGRGARTPL